MERQINSTPESRRKIQIYAKTYLMQWISLWGRDGKIAYNECGLCGQRERVNQSQDGEIWGRWWPRAQSGTSLMSFQVAQTSWTRTAPGGPWPGQTAPLQFPVNLRIPWTWGRGGRGAVLGGLGLGGPLGTLGSVDSCLAASLSELSNCLKNVSSRIRAWAWKAHL